LKTDFLYAIRDFKFVKYTRAIYAYVSGYINNNNNIGALISSEVSENTSEVNYIQKRQSL